MRLSLTSRATRVSPHLWGSLHICRERRAHAQKIRTSTMKAITKPITAPNAAKAYERVSGGEAV
jgi:hypothetical protein